MNPTSSPRPHDTITPRRSSQVLLRFLVDRVLVAEAAVLLVLHPTGMLLLVLRGRVVPVLAVGTLERDNVSHRSASGMTNINRVL